MANAAPVFNPNAPYSVIPPAAQPAPVFNPNQPYSVVPPAAQPTNPFAQFVTAPQPAAPPPAPSTNPYTQFVTAPAAPPAAPAANPFAQFVTAPAQRSAAPPSGGSSSAVISVVGPATLERWQTNPPGPPAAGLTGYAAQDAAQDYSDYLNWRAQQGAPQGKSPYAAVSPPQQQPGPQNAVGTGTNVNVIPAGIAPGPGQTNAPAPQAAPPAPPAAAPASGVNAPVTYIPPAAAPPLSAAPPVPPQPQPQPAAPGPQLIAPAQQGPAPTGPNLIAPAPPAQTFMAPPATGPQPPQPTFMAPPDPQPPPPPAPPQGTPLQGASDALFATLDAIPGASQLGALTDAALAYKFGEGSQAANFTDRYHANLAANLARLQGIRGCSGCRPNWRAWSAPRL